MIDFFLCCNIKYYKMVFFFFLFMIYFMFFLEFKVNWDENGMVMFYIVCWNVLYRLVLVRILERIFIVLIEMEKDMICEVVKIVEIYYLY